MSSDCLKDVPEFFEVSIQFQLCLPCSQDSVHADALSVATLLQVDLGESILARTEALSRCKDNPA